jgi:hypothetical protein
MTELTAALWLGLGISATWLVWYLRRVQVQWDTGETRITTLGQSLRQLHRAVADEQRNFENMQHEIKRAREQAKDALRDMQELQQKRQAALAPPPVEILVAAEFPSSASEDPWIANMVQRYGATTGDGKPAITPVLFWAAGYAPAQARAKHLAGDLQLSVNDIRRLAGAK